MPSPDAQPVAIEVEYRPAAQRFAIAAENIDPQKWKWVIVWSDGSRYGWGYAAFRWTALLWAKYQVVSFFKGRAADEVLASERIDLL